MEEDILICQDSLESIFTAVYCAYEWKCIPEHTRIQIGEEEGLRLFARYRSVETDEVRSAKVIRTLRRKFGENFYYTICLALSGCDRDKADAVYHTIAIGLKLVRPETVMEQLAESCVHRVFAISRGAGREYDHLRGFLRFSELENGVLYARIQPKNQLLHFLAEHFSDRLPGDAFLIHDVGREIFAVHEPGRHWFMVQNHDWHMIEESAEEKCYQELFRWFCHKIAIKERENTKLQNQMLPLRFQEFMTEFSENGKGRC